MYEKKLKLWNTPHVTKKRNVFTSRNRLGQFCLSNKVNEAVATNTKHKKIGVRSNSKNKKFTENPPDIADVWETIDLSKSDKKNYRQ